MDEGNQMSQDDSLTNGDGVQGLLFHPAASLFPMLSEPEIEALAADIDANGLHDRIALLDGMILGGRNRAVALDRLGLAVRLHVDHLSDNTDPIAHLLSENLHRRHLTAAQKVLVGVDLADSTWGGDRSIHATWSKPAITRAEAAERIHVSVDVVNNAASVMRKALAPVRAKIRNGEIKTFGHAYHIVTPTKDEKAEGLTSEAKQNKWLNDPKNALKRPKAPAQPPRLITKRMLRDLSEREARLIHDEIMDKANRAYALEGKQITITDL
jgi:hypothetical protein